MPRPSKLRPPAPRVKPEPLPAGPRVRRKAVAKQAYELAEAAGALKKAEALAANNNAQIEAKRVEVMPAIARESAQGLGLQHANLNSLEGGAGLAELVGALGPIYQMLTSMFGTKPQDGADNGKPANGLDISQAFTAVEEVDKVLKKDGAANS
jgi:flotillin